MNVSTIAMDKDEAREQLRIVRKQLHRRADDEYKAIEEALEHAAKGLVLIDVQQAIRNAPCDEQSRPTLAIARADRTQVEFSWSPNQTTARFSTSMGLRRLSKGIHIDIDMGRNHGRLRAATDWERKAGHGERVPAVLRGTTLVPMIPPHIREIRGCGATGDRAKYILWEVQEWKNTPPVDPYLLQHVRGTLYAVLAEWDLTPLERLVMAARANA